MNKTQFGRRRFLQGTLQGAAYAGVSGSLLGTMGLLQRAQAAANGNDYKALVCVYLDGGADSYNLLIPRAATGNPSTNYNLYAQSRGNMAIAQDQVLGLSGSAFGLHPGMQGMQALFNAGNLAAVANVGPLVEPVTKTAIENNSAVLPPQLFSHSDQTALWEKGYAEGLEPKGWVGKVADLVQDMNDSPSPSMNISLTGNNLLQVGELVLPYSMRGYDYNAAEPDRSSGGPIGLETGGARPEEARAAVEAIMETAGTTFGAEYSKVKRRGIDNYDLISSALETVPNLTAFAPYPDDDFQHQLHMVARMIAIRASLGACRQTFLVRLRGWDTHDNQLNDLPSLTQRLSDGLAAFQQAMVDLGTSNDVTSFTFSEFSRTLNSNGMGTDHGWGGHQFALGGAVSGGQIIGTMPNLTIEGPDDVNRGRIIPTYSVEQYAATLASWFGVSNGDLDTVFPNLGNFNSSDLGFVS